jgi:hypothetical protein
MSVEDPSKVSAVLINAKMGTAIKLHPSLSRTSSVKDRDLAHLPLVQSQLDSKMILNKSSMPGGISRAENSVLLRAAQRRIGTRERHSTFSI